MATLNKVMLIGRVIKDPEPPRTLPNSGTQVVRFRFAVGRGKKNESGGWDKDPNQLYIDCEAFHRPDGKRNLVELISKYVKAKDPLYVEGRLVFEEWEDKNGGGKRSKHKLVVDSLEFLGSRNSEDGGEGGGGGGGGRSYGGGGGGGGGSRQSSGGGRSGSGSPPPDSGGDDDGGGSSGSGDPIPF